MTGVDEATSSMLLALLVTTTFSRHGSAHALCRAEYYNVPNGLTHTACLPPKRGCQLIVSGLTDDEKREALRAHNDYRSQVAQGRLSSYPPASNMYRLIWDEELADVAQAFTNQCDNSDHDKKEQRITTRFQKVGQNFHWNEGFGILPGPDAKGRIDDFFAEYKDFNPSNVDPFSTSRTRGVVTHFTQVAWADTRYVGCGFTQYKLPHYDARKTTKLFACNYAPAGNTIGRSMYKKGRPCSACSGGTTCEEATGLCFVPGESDGVGISINGWSGLLWTVFGFIALGLIIGTVVGGFIYKRKRAQLAAQANNREN